MYWQTFCNKVYNVQVIFELNYFKEITRNWMKYIYTSLLQNLIIINWGKTANPKVKR